VLSVEDDIDYERLIETWLSGKVGPGFHVTPAVRLEDVARNFHPEGFDVMLLDLGLPDSVGLDTVAIAREIVSDLPIVVLTADFENVIPGRAIQSGADHCLIKGAFQPEILVDTIVEAAGRRHAESPDIGFEKSMISEGGSMDSMFTGLIGETLSLRIAQGAEAGVCLDGGWFERQRRSSGSSF
jgi:DNA-binding response OmpR family regulator